VTVYRSKTRSWLIIYQTTVALLSDLQSFNSFFFIRHGVLFRPVHIYVSTIINTKFQSLSYMNVVWKVSTKMRSQKYCFEILPQNMSTATQTPGYLPSCRNSDTNNSSLWKWAHIFYESNEILVTHRFRRMTLQISQWLHPREDHVMRVEGAEYKG
jgi:hypothetical protein